MKHLRFMHSCVSAIMLLSVGVWLGQTVAGRPGAAVVGLVAFALIPVCALALICLHRSSGGQHTE